MTKILVIDDEPDIELLMRQKFAYQIRNKKFEFIFASNGKEALNALHTHQDLHIILTDLNMPEMDGFAFLSQLTEFKRLFKTVIISAYGDMTNIRKAMNRGASDFITKPIDFKDLEITILNVTEQYFILKQALEAQQELTYLERDLIVARNLQQSILPRNFNLPNQKSFEISGTMVPAYQVGGDFFDFFPLEGDRFGFLIADVSGKGIPAAFFMAISHTILRAVAQKDISPADCLKEANRILCIDNEASMFVTTFYGIYHPQIGLIEYANAGHNPPLLLRTEGIIETIGRNQGTSLGIMPESPYYENHQLTLNLGDCLILYTDGITEARNKEDEEYGEIRLSQEIKNWVPSSISTLPIHILNSVSAFTAGTTSSDDMAVLCLKQLT